MKNLKLWITGYPNGRAIIVEIIAEREDKQGLFYIRKPDGGTDTTSSRFLFDVPAQVTKIDMTAT